MALMVSAMGVLTLGCSVGPAASKSTTGDIKHQFARPDLPTRAGALDDVVFAFPRREIRSWRPTQTQARQTSWNGRMVKQSTDPVDELLVMEAQDGDRRSIEALVLRWQKRLWTHVYRLTRDPKVAWDVTQQTWLAIINRLPRLDDPATFKAWAYRIATTKAAGHVKRRVRARSLAERACGDVRMQDKSGHPLLEFLDRLGPRKKAAVTLYYMESLTISEVGFVLGIAKGMVKSHLNSARNDLKRLCQQTAD